MSTPAILRHRRDTAANWTSNNPVIEAGQLGYETDTLKFKLGDGTTAWSSLSYASGGTGPTGPTGPTGAGGAPVLLLDELHKYPRWKLFLKGLFDTLGDGLRVVVTGSSRLDTDRKMGDSLMGRYFLYHMHPFSVAETVSQDLPDPARVIRSPKRP